MSVSESTRKTASTENSGRSRPCADRIVRRKFGAVAKLLWSKPDAAIASIAKVDSRTGRRIMRGESDVPVSVVVAVIQEMLRPIE
jgi:hypothetical protein